METPLVTTQLGKDNIAYDDAYFVGHPGMKGDRTGNLAVQNADFVLCLGASLHVSTTGYELDRFAPRAFVAQVDLDQALFDREGVGVATKCYADIVSFLSDVKQLVAGRRLEASRSLKWLPVLRRLKEELSVSREPQKEENGRLNIYRAIDVVQRASSGDEIIVADAGSAFYAIGQAWRVKGRQRVLISGGLGAMGCSLPAATGASMSAGRRTVLCLTGDGSVQTDVYELAVISHNRCDVKIIVFSNEGYLSIRNTQDSDFAGRHAGVDTETGVFLPPPSGIASAYEIEYHRVDIDADLVSICASSFAKRGPCLIEVMCNTSQEIIPSVSSKKLEDGSMVSMPLDAMSPLIGEADFKQIVSELNA